MRTASILLELSLLNLLVACSQSAREQPAAASNHGSQTQAPTSPPTAAGQAAQPAAGAAMAAAGRPPASVSPDAGPMAASSGMSAPATVGAAGTAAMQTTAGTRSSAAGTAESPPSGGRSSSPPPPLSSSKIYVSVYADSEITEIDGASYAIVGHIPVGRGPAILLETPDHSKLYTANWADNSVSAVKLATREVHAIKESGQPFVIAMSADGKFVYSGLTSNKIDVISTETDTIARSISMSQFPMSVIVSPDGGTLYVAFSGGTAQAINAQTGAVVHPALSVGAIPGWISLTPDGSTAYTLNWGSGDVSVIDTTTWKTTTTLKLGAGSDPIIGAVTPDNSLLCVTNFGTANAVIVETKTNKTLHTLMFDGRPTGVNFSPDGQQVYVTDYGHASLSSDANSLILIGTSGRLPSNPGPGRVTVFSSSTGAKLTEIAVGQWPSSVVIQ